ncbi:MAG: acyl-ACP--UDP-N-acetylglucosamine O-acyltransferase [Candidatus Omnitrophica bacterium]|nr:acyl-ACP--UDP-N-acetylglucosamine O-acyltransferase [Candidatus Omnitrophota bacterium]
MEKFANNLKGVRIHPTAIVHPDAGLGEDVEIGPFSIVTGTVKIGDRTSVGSRVTIEGNTTLGEECEIFTGAVVGSITQDKKYEGGTSYLKIGNRNKIREYVTINPGTKEGTETIIGDDNLLMAYSHVAHDCIIKNHVTLANSATLAGHVIIDDRAIVGGLVGVHQFVRIGTLAIIGGCSKVVQDVPPFMLVDGHPAKAFGINSVGLERAGVSKEERAQLKKAFKVLFRSGLSVKSAVVKIQEEIPASHPIQTLLQFLRESERGVSR